MSQTNKTNPFSTLNLPARFDLDATAIERAYLTGLTSAHPDAGGGGSGDGLSEDSDGPDAATLNQARMTLLDSEQRAVALLDVLGGASASQCKDLPDGFLMEMMTRREEIEEQIADGGNESRSNWEAWAREERASYTNEAKALFDAIAEESTLEKLVDIRVLLNAWRYIERLIEQLDPEYDPARADFR
ncbi:hypothetical protein COB72_02420 [bacterium]|nr:MAG: hypothetical protein COB72_02420 [bacterium]